jgi:hypothetical protein
MLYMCLRAEISISEIVVALLVLLIILVDAVLTLYLLLILVLVPLVGLIFRFQAALLLVSSFGPETSLGLAHLVEFLAAANMVFILEDLILLITSMLIL